MYVKARIFLIAAFVALSACGAADGPSTSVPATSATTAPPIDQSSTLPPKGAGDEVIAKLTSHLIEALLLSQQGLDFDDISTSVPELRWDAGGVMVEVQVSDLDADVIAAAEAAGLQISGQFADIDLLTGAVALSDLLDLAGLDDVETVVPAFGATTG